MNKFQSKSGLFAFVLLFKAISALAQPASVTFPVCAVPLAAAPLKTLPNNEVRDLALNLNARNENAWHNFLRTDSSLTGAEKNKFSMLDTFPARIHIEAAAKGAGNLVPTYQANAVAAAMVKAYAEHRPLILSPDMIWTLILQGFAEHIEADPEKMRPYFVNFEGEKALEISKPWKKGNPDNPWEEVFDEFGQKISANTKDNMAAVCSPHFSTTGKIEKACFDIALMRAMDSYFDYKVYLLCGIPQITLEGTPADWAMLEQHAAALAKYELGWWIEPLKPILHEFTNAASGQVNTGFWQKMVNNRSYPTGCVSKPFLSGWMLQFFPYVDHKINPWLTQQDSVALFEQKFAVYETEAQKLAAEWKIKAAEWENQPEDSPKLSKKARKKQEKARLNHLMNRPRLSAPRPERFGLKSFELDDLPGSLGKANVILNDNGTEYKLEFMAGFIGLRQDAQTLALRPEISWIILDTGLLKDQKATEFYTAWVKGH